ncbi:hypothetical protein MKK84_19480 [Methylobacterium sp. E-065]|uniref:hypothetical protein n=1 Tax=Methylobacterium sp. E-065 TaxID=2836583 RepID=UPI001FB98D8B|nr:hypothetical protein [Methylobacterium sp. E-065]MCJ2019588.1 hypothetical protein [Methylobacterium sp. E-065]
MARRGIYILRIERGCAAAILEDGEIAPVTNWVTRGEECGPAEATSCVIGPVGPDAVWLVMAGKAFAAVIHS